MPRKCSICFAPARRDIDEALLAGEPFRKIAERFGISTTALFRHKADHLPADLARAHEAQEIARADDLLGQVKAIMARVQKLFNACDEWLRDPDDPGRYDLGPRASEVSVIYCEGKAWRKAPLSELLAETGRTFKLVEVKTADPRRLILETARTLQGSLELMADVMGQMELAERLQALEDKLNESAKVRRLA